MSEIVIKYTADRKLHTVTIPEISGIKFEDSTVEIRMDRGLLVSLHTFLGMWLNATEGTLR